ncbi:MAG TPA: hypothetical protein VJT15_15165 [Pyrinomonadaceae bacterium]|nr:hypothetical protein [Pyrinomonadaceae bacterium]
MRKRNTLIISLLLLCVVAGGAIWITSNSAAQSKLEASKGEARSSLGEGKSSNPLSKINGKARAANKGGGESEVRALADEIFTTYQFDEAPAGVGDIMKERLVRAELSYRDGQGQKGISDASIVRAVNYLAYKLGAPAYAQTDVFELRRMKSAILPYTGDLQSRSRAAEVAEVLSGGSRKSNPNDANTPTMSPLEAVVFMTALVQQKQFNPEYQLTNEEFVALHGNKRQANSEKTFRSKLQSRTGDSSRSKQLVEQVEKHAATMSLSEIVNLPDELMYVLGIGK